MILYGAFKGMGDFICATPAIQSELQSGHEVTVLIFPQVAPIIELLDFGVHRKALHACELPVRGADTSAAKFFRDMSRLSPTRIYISPHAPAVAASWKIPILLWVLKKRYWPSACLIGADSEPLSRLFDEKIPVNRYLPYSLREWTFYSGRQASPVSLPPPKICFKESLTRLRQQPPDYDIVIHPGAGTENRKWPVAFFSELVASIPRELRIAVVGIAPDVALLKAALPPDRAIAFLSGSLEAAIASIARSRLALTMDSGSMYFADLLNVPTIALFGPSNPANVVGPDSQVTPLYEEKWSCQPCRRPACSQRQVYCMTSIKPKSVMDAIALALSTGWR